MILALDLLRAEVWAVGVLAVVLIVAAYTDLRYGKIYNWLTLPAVALGVIGHTLAGGLAGGPGTWSPLGLAGSLLGLAVGFLPLLVIWQTTRGINGGDVKLMAAVGALTGWQFTLSSMFYGLIAAALMALAVILHHGIFKRTVKRIFRFLWLAMCATKPGDVASPDSPKVAFGVALCVGTAAHLVDALCGGPVCHRLLGSTPGLGM